MAVTLDQERWAEALMVERLHGDRALDHIAERLADLARKGDEAGIQRWREIADRFDELRDPGTTRS